MRRLLAAAVAIAAASLAALGTAGAQDNGFSAQWRDPMATSSGVAYLDSPRTLYGEVFHQRGIESVALVLVDDPDADELDGDCEPAPEPREDPVVERSATSAVFGMDATFPCNGRFLLRVTARAPGEGGIGGEGPATATLHLPLAVALPPAPVPQVDAILEVDGDSRTVTLQWPASSEPDLLGYVVTRVTDGERETLDQLDAEDETELVDDDPPPGETSTYEVTAVRRGPDAEVEQVSSLPTAVDVEVPGDETTSDGDGTQNGDEPSLTTVVTGAPEQGRPDAGSLSTVRSRGPAPAPSPPTTLDTGFVGTLPFEAPAPGEVAAPPAGDPAVVATFDTSEDPLLKSKDAMSMIAGGLALFVGALVVVYVTRRAASVGY